MQSSSRKKGRLYSPKPYPASTHNTSARFFRPPNASEGRFESFPSIRSKSEHSRCQRFSPPNSLITCHEMSANHPSFWVHARALCVTVTQSEQMSSRRIFLLTALASAYKSPAASQSVTSEFSVDVPHPRLLLPARRLRLLKREKERDSMRWVQFKTVMQGGRELPEPGFAHALYYVIAGDAEQGRRAIQWALTKGNDLRQAAIVFDWCHDLLSDDDRNKLAALLRNEIEKPLQSGCARETESNTSLMTRAPLTNGSTAPPNSCNVALLRSRVLAAVALAQHSETVPERELEFVIKQWWSTNVIPALKRGESPFGRDQTYPLMELLHAIRDNLRMDLREEFKSYFAVLPLYHLLTYYPASYPGPANELRIPVILDRSEPDLDKAALSRAAELAMVAYDANALEVQFLQGWCMQDRFIMRDPFGAPYEFLWANPYHPGLSYYNAPLLFHDAERGLLIAREHWDDGAKWFFHIKGEMQTFRDGKIQHLAWDQLREPIAFVNLTVWPLKTSTRFRIETEEQRHYFLIGLDANQKYDLEVDDEEVYEKKADAGGIVVVEAPGKRKAGVRLHKVDVQAKSG